MKKLENIKYIILTAGLSLLFMASVRFYQTQSVSNDSLESSSSLTHTNISTLADWFSGSSLGALFGTLLILLFLRVHLKDFKQKRRIRYLQNKGKKITTTLRKVELDQELEAKGLKPYRICTEWLNPNASALHIFKSDYLLFDPSDMLEEGQITAFIDEKNPSNYHLDLSFLNQVSNESRARW